MSSRDIDSSLLPATVQAAAHEAAIADGLIPQSGTLNARGPNDDSSKGKVAEPALRRGKWTSEEECYAVRLISEFRQGLLPLTDGTTLRTFLSKLLNCDPMRISKKFVGQNCIGKVSTLILIMFIECDDVLLRAVTTSISCCCASRTIAILFVVRQLKPTYAVSVAPYNSKFFVAARLS